MFTVTVTAKLSTHAKIKCTELLMYVKKIHQFLSMTEKDTYKRKLVLFFCLTV